MPLKTDLPPSAAFHISGHLQLSQDSPRIITTDTQATVLYTDGKQAYYRGDYQQAVQSLTQLIQYRHDHQQTISAQEYNHAATATFALGHIRDAQKLFKLAIDTAPHQYPFLTNYAFMALKLGDYCEAETALLRSCQMNKNFIPTLDGLAHVYGMKKDYAQSQYFGRLSLQAKDQAAAQPDNLTWLKTQLQCDDLRVDANIPPFQPDTPQRNVIAFSLWGGNKKYIDNALLNARLVPIIYPGWSCWFYLDQSIPYAIQQQLIAMGAKLKMMPASKWAYYGLFWRFFVANDPHVDRYLIRDCDSVINCQERVAVDEWLASDKHFHLMRNWCSHTELILAGLWGGVQGALPALAPLVDAYYTKRQHTVERTIDQRFLRECIWPFIKQSHLAHDDVFCFGNAQAFPRYGQFPSKKWHVGQNWSTPKILHKTFGVSLTPSK